jgi:hypothetical protein
MALGKAVFLEKQSGTPLPNGGGETGDVVRLRGHELPETIGLHQEPFILDEHLPWDIAHSTGEARGQGQASDLESFASVVTMDEIVANGLVFSARLHLAVQTYLQTGNPQSACSAHAEILPPATIRQNALHTFVSGHGETITEACRDEKPISLPVPSRIQLHDIVHHACIAQQEIPQGLPFEPSCTIPVWFLEGYSANDKLWKRA